MPLRRHYFVIILVSCAVILSCGGSGPSSGTGGSPNTGGAAQTGGSTGTGGLGATGGRASTGGATATGGRGTGGALPGTGGALPGTGGARGGAGGGSGGGPATGGTATGGAGARAGTSGSTGGATGSTGGATGQGGATASSGCGKTPPASQRYTIMVDSASREYILSVPSNYNPNTPYRLIFAWHPWGGSAQQVAGTGNSGYYGLKGSSNNQAILVSPEGLDFGGNGLGWGNQNGADIAFLRAMLERFKAEMCIDEGRIFSAGFSFGGMMSNAVACSGLARAVAPMAGNSTVAGCASGTQPVAYMGFHGDHDSVVDIAGGRTARDVFVKRNHCTSQTTSAPAWCDGLAANYKPCMCVSYEGCDAGYPVTWCEYNADHQAAPNSGPTLWSFFSQF